MLRFFHCLPLALLALADCRAAEPAPTLFSLDPPVFLPDGSEFKTWESPTPLSFRRTYHVAAGNPKASDANPGTEGLPFATIGQAARVLQPGERALIHAGIYRERVTPARGGTGPAEMISYEAAPGEKVVLSGALSFHPHWEAASAEGEAPVWRAAVPDALFPGPNPFDAQNIPPDGFKHWLAPFQGQVPLILPRGMVFQDDRRLRQVAARGALTEEGTFWVDRPARQLYVRPFGGDPGKAAFEVADRDTVFAPDQAGLGYVRVKGLTVERVAGPWPMPQLGAISTGAGHHWIVEDNTVRWDNGIGIDLGTQHGHQPPEILATVGHHIVRRNVVTDCGVCGIAGLGPKNATDFGLLIEDNVVLRNAYEPVEETIQETGGIKTHQNQRCLIRRNLIADTYHGPGVWLDWDNGYSRLTQNVLLRNHSKHGAIFLEFSIDPTLVDRNVIWDTEGNGIYEHDTRGNIFARNLIGKSTRAAFHLHGKMTDRQLDGREPLVAGAHRVLDNVEFQNHEPDVVQGEPGLVAGNRVVDAGIVLDETALELAWPALGTGDSVPVPGVLADFFDRPFPSAAGAPGPFLPEAAPVLRLWPLVPDAPLSPAPDMPSEIVSYSDPASGRPVRQLTGFKGHSHHLYFTNPGWWDEGRRLLFGSDRMGRTNLFSVHLESGEIVQHTDADMPGPPRETSFLYAAVHPARPECCFWRGREMIAIDLVSNRERILWTHPEGFIPNMINLTADGRYACSVLYEDLSHRFRVALLGGHVGFVDYWEARPLSRIVRVPLDGGPAETVWEETAWIGHINTSPTQPHLLTFCHEGPWERVDNRIWTLDLAAGKARAICQRADPGQLLGHEYWLADGLHVGYHGFEKSREADWSDPFLFGFARHDGEERRDYHSSLSTGHVHSLDGELVVGDGEARIDGATLRVWKRKGDRMEGPRVLARHDCTARIQQLHVHPRFSPDGASVVFTSDRTTYGQVYEVGVGDWESLPLLEKP